MKHIKILFLFIIIFGVCSEFSHSQEYRLSLDVRVPSMPEFLRIDGRQVSYYELYLTNFSEAEVIVKKLEVINIKSSQVIASFDKNALLSRVNKASLNQKGDEITLAPNQTGIIYIETTFPNGFANQSVKHRFQLESKGEKDLKTFSIDGAFTVIKSKPPVIIGSPLRVGNWATVFDPAWERGHRRVFYTVDGKARIPGRYAIDFIKLNEQGKYAKTNEDQINQWYGYGAEVLAVVDAVVASTRDDFQESPTISGHPKYPPEKATGNYISLNIGNNLFAFYEHLKPGSIKVKPGQKVNKGDVIALLGFTGQTTGPHLHFHIADADSPLGAEGVAFVFEKFTILGKYSDFANFGKSLWVTSENSNKLISNEHPAPNSVIRFPNR